MSDLTLDLSFEKTQSIQTLEKFAKRTRLEIFKFKTRTGYGHLSSCLSCVDILISIYLDAQSKFDFDHDRLIFGKGHGSPAVYPILAGLGVIKGSELDKYCSADGILRLHADFTIPGCFYVGGSLGNGIGFATGLALARPWQHFYVLLGDAELYEGSVWETLIFISHHNLRNITIIVDRNQMGILGKTEETLRLESLKKKFESFGIETSTLDGHNLVELRKFFSIKPGMPRLLIAETIKGKGVSFMEGKYEYHTIIPKSEKEIELGLKELTE